MLVTPSQRWTGAAAIALAILFNIPYAILAATYDYPDVLRGPPGQALDLFAAGGAVLVLTWHGFALAALALAPLAVALAITPLRLERSPRLALGAAIFGVLAGFSQAMGLWRWVVVIPPWPGTMRRQVRATTSAWPPSAASHFSTSMAGSRSENTLGSSSRRCLSCSSPACRDWSGVG